MAESLTTHTTMSASPKATDFMLHDRWHNVLFLHWRLTPELASLVREAVPFKVDTIDNDVWAGLVLLTEVNVGPGKLLRGVADRCGLVQTHHGCNVRIYVESSKDPAVECGDVAAPSGVYFFSLECSKAVLAAGAVCAGIPYRLATMTRNTYFSSNDDGRRQHFEILSERRSASEYARTCGATLLQRAGLRGGDSMSSVSLHRTLVRGRDVDADGVDVEDVKTDVDSTSAGSCSIFDSVEETSADVLTVKCRWSVKAAQARASFNGEGVASSEKDRDLARQFTERYHVYTNHVGARWRGTVRHMPWPIADVDVETLEIDLPEEVKRLVCPSSDGSLSAHDRAYAGILSEMASRAPDHKCFSPGVGPVCFEWLRRGY